MASLASAEDHAQALLSRILGHFDPRAFDLPSQRKRIRLVVRDGDVEASRDVLVGPSGTRLERSSGRPDALISADRHTWQTIADDMRAGWTAYRSGRLRIRHNLHLAMGLLAAVSPRQPGRLQVHCVGTRGARVSTMEAGTGEPVVMLHGLGATKGSFLPTIAALSSSHRAIAIDLPGFGDAQKPVGAAYNAAFFARSVIGVLDQLGLDAAHVVGHSMGGRVALELGLVHPQRVRSLVLMTPSLAWRRARPWAAYLRLLRPELGIFQPAPRAIVEPLVRRLVPGASGGWSALAVDEFLRSFLDPRGRAAFYAAARSIYLEEPTGPNGFWERLPGLRPPALFIWGRHDRLVPMGFERHVREALPGARHLILDSGHVPQLEQPAALHAAMRRFLADQHHGARAASGGAFPSAARR